jgi:cytochrome P450
MANQLLEWSHSMVAMYQFRRDRAVEDAAVAATIAFTTYMKELVAERRAAPRDDLISHLVAARDGKDALSEDELVVNCILLLNAGHEASVHAIANAIRLILELGASAKSCLSNKLAVEGLVEETLRYEPPLHMFTRYALEDMEIHGVSLRFGDKVGLLLGSANRDEQRFANAHRFDPGRPSQGHVTMGAGLHFCIGAPLARLEMHIALAVLFERLPGLAIAEAPRWRDSYHFHGLEGLRLAW